MMRADKKTMRLPDDVLTAIRQVRIAGGYPSDTAALCAIVRLASPAILARFAGFSPFEVTEARQCTDSVPTLAGQDTNEDDPTLAAMAAIDFDLDI